MTSFIVRAPAPPTAIPLPFATYFDSGDDAVAMPTPNSSFPLPIDTDDRTWSSTATIVNSGETYFDLVWYGVIVPILYGLVTVLGVTGNSLVIYVIMTRERMRTVTNLLLLNLAVADLCFVVVIPPPTAYVIAANRWPFGDAPCRLMHYLVNVTAYVTVYTLVLIAVIRYMTIVHTARTARVRTTRHVIAAIAGVWILMLAVNAPVLVSYGTSWSSTAAEDNVVDLVVPTTSAAAAAMDDDYERPDASAVGTAASVVVASAVEQSEQSHCRFANKQTGQRIFATFFAFAYVLPLCVIAGFSVGIVRHITRHKAPNTASSVSSGGSSAATGSAKGMASSSAAAAAAAAGTASSVSSTSGGRRKSSHSANRKRQAGLMLVLVVVMFAVLWFPVHIHLLLQQFELLPNNEWYEAISVLWNCLAYFNSCVNPIIYNRTSKEFRDAFVDACRCRRGDPGAKGRSGSSSRSGGNGRDRRFGGCSPSPDVCRPVSLVTRLTPDGRRHASAGGSIFGLHATGVGGGAAGGCSSGVVSMQRSATTSERLLVPLPSGGDGEPDSRSTDGEQARRKSDFLTVPLHTSAIALQ